MKYFTKYLPKPGGFSRVIKDHGIPVDYEQEVRLFLCTREIEVGDKVKFQLAPDHSNWQELEVIDVYKDENEHTATLQDGDFKIYTTPDKWCFKVIGPISSEATWVKEGMEFEEDEVKLIKICHDDSHPPYDSYCSYCCRSSRCGNDEGDEAFIKGPCGHFH